MPIDLGKTTCLACGANLFTDELLHEQPAPRRPAFCRNCGTRMQPEDEACPSCGTERLVAVGA